MSSDTRHIHFALMQCRSKECPSIQMEISTTNRFDSLETTCNWVEGFELPIKVRAFVSIEVLSESLMNRSRILLNDHDIGDQIHQILEGPIIRFVRSLCDLETPIDNDEGDETKLRFFIFDIPVGTPQVIPGVYIEVSHGNDLSENVVWWRERNLPGTIFGHASIELPSKAILPNIKTLLVEDQNGDPDPLEELLRDGLVEIFDHIISGQ